VGKLLVDVASLTILLGRM